MKRLVVWWEGRTVGYLTQDRHGELGFCYDAEWLAAPAARPLSASLPLRPEPFPRRACRPFFGGLLPEEGQRTAVAQALGISAANDFALLDRLGGDVAGALQFLPPGETPRNEDGPFVPHFLDESYLWSLLEALPQRPLLAGEKGLRLSLAGAQSKLPVVFTQDRIALPAPGQPTTHILKPPITRFPATTENEAFAMRLAAASGLDVAPVEARRLEGPDARTQTFLLVTRYDRVQDGEGNTRRLHQEDFCQALGIAAERKYQAEGGPGLEDCFRLLRRESFRPAADVLKLLDAVIFNAALGNADAHAKNFSLIIGPHGTTLAPLYDLLSTARYPDLSPKFAMKIGRAATLETISPKDWAHFADQAELGQPLVQRRVRDLGARIGTALDPVREALRNQGLDEEALDAMRDMVAGRLAWLRNGSVPE